MDEIEALSRVFSDAPRPVMFILGGTKVDDSLLVAKHVLAQGFADDVLMTGVVANIFLSVPRGYGIGIPSKSLITTLRYDSLIPKAADLITRFRDKILLPSHVAVRLDGARIEFRYQRSHQIVLFLILVLNRLQPSVIRSRHLARLY